MVSGPCGPVSLWQKEYRMLGQAILHTVQWNLWVCGPPAEYDNNIGVEQTPLQAVILVPVSFP